MFWTCQSRYNSRTEAVFHAGVKNSHTDPYQFLYRPIVLEYASPCSVSRPIKCRPPLELHTFRLFSLIFKAFENPVIIRWISPHHCKINSPESVGIVGILESSDIGPSRADLAMAHGSRLSRTAPSLGEVPMTFIPGSRVPCTRTIILMYSTASAPMLNPKRQSIAQRTDTVHSFFSGQPALTSCNRTSCGDALRVLQTTCAYLHERHARLPALSPQARLQLLRKRETCRSHLRRSKSMVHACTHEGDQRSVPLCSTTLA